eukprot:9020453-Ditylum_brightwellii.AAC.1
MHVCIAQNHHWRKQGRPKNDYDKYKVTIGKLKRARLKKHKAGRLCSNLENFNKHIASKLNVKTLKPCEVCGLECYTKCNLCNTAVHYFPQKGSQKNQTCFVDVHSDYFFGLARNDATMVGKKQIMEGTIWSCQKAEQT